ncbi:Lid2 complex component snt2 [Sphaceloma murrayae]|uniref:Lid2 complex component snt2 n=1 Tax=Sphaceloma murrayae TaxID=2082308 RepID=A0A2K1QSF5_9PEZI|nr:Lid2 complex component snt2 [Sphaceloma murrayae]
MDVDDTSGAQSGSATQQPSTLIGDSGATNSDTSALPQPSAPSQPNSTSPSQAISASPLPSSSSSSSSHHPPPAAAAAAAAAAAVALAAPASDVAIKSEAADSGPATDPAAPSLSESRPSPPPHTSKREAASHSQSATPQPAITKDPGPSQMSSSNDDVPAVGSYGTRSRNRGGASRVNYAEDQEMDYEFTSAVKPSESKRNSTANDIKRTSDAHESRLRTVSDAAGGDDGSASDAAAPNTKKRKAAGSATPAAQPTPTPAPVAISSSLRKSIAKGTPPPRRPETNMMFFDKSKAKLNKDNKLIADDGTAIGIDDHVYLISEPPGDPYYLCRIMEFVHSHSSDPTSSVTEIRVNWFYRPRDVQRYNNDTRLVYGTMHSDICPITSLRGKCQITHRSDIDDLDQYRKIPDSFWFNQIFDRFIRRFYEVIPTSQVINVPEKVKKALDERWRFIAVEASRVKEMTGAVKLCKRCSQYCASHDSVDCAMCGNSYHMNCVRPPLPKKPSRGFAWACGPCSRAQEKRLEARLASTVGGPNDEIDEDMLEEEEEEPAVNDSTRAPTPDEEHTDKHPATQAEIALAKMWPMRYLGIHCRVEDALQYDDRAIYPRASSRLGPRHQANTILWHGRPVELVKPTEIKKRFVKSSSHKKDAKLSKETLAAIEADRAEKAKRPPWVLDEPVGYVERGEDYPNDDPRNTAQLIFKMPPNDQDHSPAANEAFITAFMQQAQTLARPLRVSEYGVNLMDKALSLLIENDYNDQVALELLRKVDRGKDLKEPIFTHEDLRKFEEGVAKYGSEHRLIKQHMKTHLPISSIIRFYYLWKKTPRGHQIWDNYGGRKSNKKQKQENLDAATKLQQEVADDADDSAFDSAKATRNKREFQCKFCNKKHSSQWRRAPGITPGQTAPAEKGASKDKTQRPLLALCLRCAGLWRKYAIQWEGVEEFSRSVAQGSGKSYKRKIDEELAREVEIENNLISREGSEPMDITPEPTNEPTKKKAKVDVQNGVKAKPVPAKPPTPPPPPPIIPDQPKLRTLPCFVCKQIDIVDQAPVSCTHCKLTVHKQCYGISDKNIGSKWVCDQCTNDRTPLVSTDYNCALCPIEFTPCDLWEAPKVTHKKKTDRDREKERLEKELLEKAKNEYTRKQSELNRPLQPREPLKKTDGNNWVHVLCAVWTPEIKFSDATKLERAEGFGAIPIAKYDAMCKLCKNSRKGACISCQQCHGNFHVACAFEAGYTFGFDITPVKGSRKDQVKTITMGQETGFATPAVWCKDHSIKTTVHPMTEAIDDSGKSALEAFVETYKQADQTLTGTARKANSLSLSIRGPAQTTAATAAGKDRRASTIGAAATRKARNSIVGGIAPDDTETASPTTVRDPSFPEQPDKKCAKCRVDVSPAWYKLPPVQVTHGPASINGLLNRPLGINGVGPHENAKESIEYECHKCHLSAKKPPQRIPLSPKPLNIKVEWPPSLSTPNEMHIRQIWTDQPAPFRNPHESPAPGYFRPGEWPYGQSQAYQPPHYGHHPSQAPPHPPAPNAGHQYGRPDGPPPTYPPAHAGPGNHYFDRLPQVAGPTGPPMPPRSGHPHHPQTPQYGQSQSNYPPHHQGPPPPFARASGSPFGHPSNISNPSSTPQLPPGTSPALSIAQPAGQPSTPKTHPLDPRANQSNGASNSPHIGNLLS